MENNKDNKKEEKKELKLTLGAGIMGLILLGMGLVYFILVYCVYFANKG